MANVTSCVAYYLCLSRNFCLNVAFNVTVVVSL